MTPADWKDDPSRPGGDRSDSEDIEIVSIEAVDETGAPLDGIDGGAEDAEIPRDREDRTAREESLSAARAELEALRGEHQQLMERHLRLLAEFDNYRRRRDREAAEERGEGVRDVLKSALPVLDNLERALEALPPATLPSVRTGIELVLRQLRSALGEHGLVEIDALGEAFDPHRHEALAMVPRTDFEDQRVIEQMQKGYEHAGRLLRPALVKIVSNPEGSTGAVDQAAPAADEEAGWDG